MISMSGSPGGTNAWKYCGKTVRNARSARRKEDTAGPWWSIMFSIYGNTRSWPYAIPTLAQTEKSTGS